MEPIRYAPKIDHVCDDPFHSNSEITLRDTRVSPHASDIRTAPLDRVSLRQLKEEKFTGSTIFVIGLKEDLRIAKTKGNDTYDRCGFPRNSNEHLCKNNKNDPESVLGAGELYWEGGEIKAINNFSEAFAQPGTDDSGGYLLMLEMKKVLENKLGKEGALDLRPYHSFHQPDYFERIVQF